MASTRTSWRRLEQFRCAPNNAVTRRLRPSNGQLLEQKRSGYSGRGREAGAGRVVL